MKLQFIVTIEYRDFAFDDGEEALKFARTAKQAFLEDEYHKEIDVSINVKIVEVDLGDKEKEEE